MKRKSIYKFLVGVSLMGAVGTQVLVNPPIVQAQDFSSQKGSFIVGGVAINVRSQPSPDASLENQYQPGEKINYDQIGTANGYRWISYVGGSGQRRYVAIGTADGSQSFGSLSEDSSPASSVPSSETLGTATSSSTLDAFLAGDFSEIAGIWENAEGHQIQFESFDITGVEELQNGSIQISTTSTHQLYHLVPAETEREILGTATDASQPRLIDVLSRGGGFSADKSVYYRVAETSPAEEPVAAASAGEEVATPVSQVNVDAVLAGDFSSVAGLWQNGFVDWSDYEVFSDGTLHHIGTDGHVTVMRLALPTLKENGKLEGGIVTVDGGFVGAAYGIMSAGVDASTNMGQDSSDQSRDRMGFGQMFDPSEPRIFYYRVAEPAQEQAPATDNQPSASKAESTTSSSSQTIKPSSKTATKPSSSQSTTSNATATSSAPESTKSFKTFLPLTGEALSLLGFLGVGFLLLGLLGFKRRK